MTYEHKNIKVTVVNEPSQNAYESARIAIEKTLGK